MRKILVSITTTYGSRWRSQVKEIKKLGLKEVALFPTCLKEKQRKELYELVEEAGVGSVPLVHIRNDMPLEELAFLIKKFNVRAFNIHTRFEFPFLCKYPAKFKKMIFIENVYQPFNEKEIKEFGGICLDISHLENDRLIYPEKFKHNVSMLKKYPLGCNHVSSFPSIYHREENGYKCYYSHSLKELSHLNYLKNYPKKYFSEIIALELKNSLVEQLKAREYLIKEIRL